MDIYFYQYYVVLDGRILPVSVYDDKKEMVMPVADGEIFKFDSEEKILSDYLESIGYQGNPQEITYETDEFSAVCPFSGLPDIAKIKIVYIP
ncbi:MAG: hypothetical protein GY754_09260, partial [bacterium]|nr:hypothetical protein [bacterium]